MKLHIFALLSLAALSIASPASDGSQSCGDGAVWATAGFACKFTCTAEGVIVDCSAPGCKCLDYNHYYNTRTKSCMEVNCENMNCVGEQNEQFFNGCQSGSRDRCRCSMMVTMDCRRGCMCKNGFCRKDGRCVKRDCEHPFFKDS